MIVSAKITIVLDVLVQDLSNDLDNAKEHLLVNSTLQELVDNSWDATWEVESFDTDPNLNIIAETNKSVKVLVIEE